MYTELYHHGIKGQRWGVRRFQNEDGSLIRKNEPSNRKKVSKKLNKYVNAYEKNMRRTTLNTYMDSYNKAVSIQKEIQDRYEKENAGKKKSKNYYTTEYDKYFGNEVDKIFKRSMNEQFKNDKSFKKATELVKRYNMESFDDLAKTHMETVRAMEEYLN